jgi:hypothetical protein
MLRGERFGGSFFKTPVSRKVTRKIKHDAAKQLEDKNKQQVRKRDRYCRFPHCPCRNVNLLQAVAHLQHKGAGGNPKGDRSIPSRMILLCSARHRENIISLDRGTVRIRPLERGKGTGGPCAFDVDLRAFPLGRRESRRPLWIEIGRETSIHVLEPIGPDAQSLLDKLKDMTL